MIREILSLIGSHEDTLKHISKRIIHPGQQLEYYAQRLDELWLRMQRGANQQLNHSTHRFANLTRALEALSPLAILNRGYSITFDEKGNALQTATQVKPGDILQTRLAKGTIQSQVISCATS
jgi:exodeoxyribonuclease VII large subunit